MKMSLLRRPRTRVSTRPRTHAFLVAVALIVAHASQAQAYRCPQSPSPAKTATYQGFLGRVYALNGQELPYRLFVPAGYDPNTAYPLVLYLHHAGLAGTDRNNESGWDNCVQLTSEIGSGDDYGGVFTHQAVDKDGKRFATQQRYPHFVLAPHANSPSYGFGGGVAGSATSGEHPTRRLLWAILEQVQKEFNIDPSRLYVTGISMGCYGTWDIIMRKPGVFAAASPQSCRGDPNQTLLAALKDMPIWSMCGTNDSYFSGAQAMADAMKQVGATAFTFTAMQGVGHSINDRGYDYPGFIDWMFAQRLPGANPTGSGGAGGAGGAGSGGAGGAGAGGRGSGGASGTSGGSGDGGAAGRDAGAGPGADGPGTSGTDGDVGTGGITGTGGFGVGGEPGAGGSSPAGAAGTGTPSSGAGGTSSSTGSGGAAAAGAAGGASATVGAGGRAGDPGRAGDVVGGCAYAVTTTRPTGGRQSVGALLMIVAGIGVVMRRRRRSAPVNDTRFDKGAP